MARPEKVRLGDLLLQQNVITQDQLSFALDQQKRNGRKLGRVLVDNLFVTEENISEALAHQLSIPYINLKNFHLNLATVRLLPESQARRFRAIVLEERNGTLLIGMADPTDLAAFDDIASIVKRNIDLAVVTEGQLLQGIDRGYRRTEEVADLTRELSEEIGGSHIDFGSLADSVGTEDASVVKLMQAMFDDATQRRASDIHIEPHEGRLAVRFRIDGALHMQKDVEHKIASALRSRLKRMAGLDMAESQLPQDGHFHVRVDEQAVDVRVSTLPTQYGEALVMHLLRQDERNFALDKLGMPAEILKRLRSIIRRGNGMLLVAGPADSGKTATLYSVLSEINSADHRIITVEDPVECRFPGVSQVQVNEKIGLSFPLALKSTLLQDPDVILVSEIRDAESVQIVLRAAMAGRLVFSTLHASNAADTLFRLVDMGIPRFMVASSVQAVVAQRLLRRVCPSCKEAYVPSLQEGEWLKSSGVQEERWGGLLRGRGCPHCSDTGYRGRMGAYEMLEMNRELLEASAHQSADQFMQEASRQMRGKSLIDHALEQMLQGQTTVAEVMRISSQIDD